MSSGYLNAYQLGYFFFGRGSHISRDMCFPVRETDITKKHRMNGH